jgi:hypothetical protein
MKKYALALVVFLILHSAAFSADWKESSIKVIASSGTGDYAPERAVDGDFSTRWSSDFSDDQWLLIEFEEPRSICGLVLHWETAFGEKYTIEAKDAGGRWHTVNETMYGDGDRDILYFKPLLAKKIKFRGIERGTGWGYSLWQIEFLDGSNPPTLSASSWIENGEPELGLDGNPQTYWQSGKEEQAELTVQLPKVWELGGVLIRWGDNYAKKYTLDVSIDGDSWKEIYRTENGRGKTDFIFFKDPEKVQVMRVNCLESATGRGYSMAHVEIKGPEAKATPIRIIQAAARDLPQGLYPMWLTRQQCFWTVMSNEYNEYESLISEWGSVEPYQGGFTVMPFIIKGDELITWNDCQVTQSLEEDYLPIPSVTWQGEGWQLNIKGFTIGEANNPNTFVRYQLKNTGRRNFKGSLMLAVYPVQLNPVWQRGGFSPINTLEFTESSEGLKVNINRDVRIISQEKPNKFGATDSTRGDVVNFLLKRTVPDRRSVQDNQGLASAAMIYEIDLKPGESKGIVICYLLRQQSSAPPAYQNNPKKFFEEELLVVKRRWKEKLGRFKIEIPEKKLIDVMKANMAYILINQDGPWIKPGPRNYSHSWMRDGAMTSAALLRMGIVEPVYEWLEAVTPHIHNTGVVPYIFFDGGHPVGFNYDDASGEGKEFDSQGQYVFAVRQYIDYTGDESVLDKFYEPALRAMRFQRQLREQRLTSEYKNKYELQPYYGILPKSNSHEGYYPARHSHWDNFWGLRGLKDAIYLAELKGDTEGLKWLEDELDSFRSALKTSIMETIKRHNINHIPGCVELADNDVTSTSIAVMMAGEQNLLPQEQLKTQYDGYYEYFVEAMKPGNERTFTPYEVRNAEAFIRMGQRQKALTMLRFFVEDSVRPQKFNHMAEVVHARYRAPSYIGDMPHTWVGSGYINTIRTIFVYEENDKLYIGAGLDPAWFEEGISVKGLPTIYGKLDYTVNRRKDEVIYKIKGNLYPPGGFIVPLPEEYSSSEVYLNGRKTTVNEGRVTFKRLPVEIIIKI